MHTQYYRHPIFHTIMIILGKTALICHRQYLPKTMNNIYNRGS